MLEMLKNPGIMLLREEEHVGQTEERESSSEDAVSPASPCVSPQCCGGDLPACPATRRCLPTVNARVCGLGMCASQEEVDDYVRQSEQF